MEKKCEVDGKGKCALEKNIVQLASYLDRSGCSMAESQAARDAGLSHQISRCVSSSLLSIHAANEVAVGIVGGDSGHHTTPFEIPAAKLTDTCWSPLAGHHDTLAHVV